MPLKHQINIHLDYGRTSLNCGPLRKFAVLDALVRNVLVTGHRSENFLSNCFLKTGTHTIDPERTGVARI